MKKFLILFCFSMCLSTGIYAQSGMTDNQIMEFIIHENEQGTSREDIVAKLVDKGVSMDQIQRLRGKYDRERGNQQLGSRNMTGINGSRLRENNGDKRNLNTNDRNRRTSAHDGSLQGKSTFESREESIGRELDPILSDQSFMSEGKIEHQDAAQKQVFGRNIFNRKNLNFEPEMNIATPEDYRIGPGDVVFVDIWGASQKSFHSVVSPEGDIDIEGYGPLSVSGMTVATANKELRSSLGQFFGGSNVKLTVGQTKTISINVMGEVVAPGTYSLSAFSTVFHALYMAGGTNDIGTLRDIKVYRDNKEITNVDIYDYILHGKMTGNIRLKSGDVIIVGPYKSLVNISGKVRRPMYYEMKDKESLGSLVDFAGGFTGDAYQNNLRLIRKQGGMMSVFSVDEFERNKFQMYDGDSVYVDSVLNRFSNMVDLRGAVRRPGLYQMDGNVTTVRSLFEIAGGLTEDAFAERVIMHRRKADRTLEVLSFNANDLLSHQVPDITLRNEDVIFVPDRSEVLGKRVFKILGEVLYPGEYVYAENTTVEDLILQAGGMTDAGSLARVEVSRRIRNNQATEVDTIVAQHFAFSVKDGFVVEGQPGFVLEPYDEVFVRRSPAYIEQEHVTINGEVNFSGEYVLTKKNQRLSELIKMAGGLTPEAYSKGARLERILTYEEKLKQKSLLRLATMGDSLSMDKLALGDTRFVGINLDKALANPGNDEWDIILQKGDKLFIPQFNNTVTISGEVMYPNTVVYKDGEKLKYYINQAGGYSVKAKSSRVFSVNMNGTVTRVKSAKDIEPGCEIVVPAKNKRNRLSFGEIMGLGTMSASLATIIATLIK